MLGSAALFEGISWFIALRETLAARDPGENVWDAFRESKDPSVYTVLAEDSAALLGLLAAFLGVWLSHHFNNVLYDAGGSLVIGAILIVVAFFLAWQSRGLLVGESADERTLQRIRAIVADEPNVRSLDRLLTMHLGPDDILLNIDATFAPDLDVRDLAVTIGRVENKIRESFPAVRRIFIETRALRNAPPGAATPRSAPQ